MNFRAVLIGVCIVGGMYSSFDIILALLLVLLCRNHTEALLACLVCGPLCESAFVLVPGFTFSALVSLLLIGQVILSSIKTRNFKTINTLFVLLAALMLCVIYNYIHSYLFSLDSIELSEIIMMASRVALAWSIITKTRLSNFCWSKFWSTLTTTGIIVLAAAANSLRYAKSSINWYNEVERIGFAGADLNEFSITSVALIPLLVGNSRANIVNARGFAVVGITLAVLSQTVSLSGVITFAICIFMQLFRERSMKVLAISLLIPSLFGWAALSNQIQESSIGKRASYILQGNSVGVDVGSGRLTVWEAALEGMSDRLFLFGIGPGNTTERSFQKRYSGHNLVTHNTLLQFLISFGGLGVVAVVGLCRKYRRIIFPIASAPLACSLILLIAGSLTLCWLWKDMLWIVCALIIGNNLHASNTSNHALSC